MKIGIGRTTGILVLLLALSVGFLPGKASAINVPPGPVSITVASTGGCLDVRDGSNAHGALVQVYTCLPNHYNQKWLFTEVPNSGGYYQIKAMNSGMCLDVIGNNPSDSAGLNQWDCHMDWPNQQWRVQSVYPSGNHLIAKHSGKCADVLGGSTLNGARIIQYYCYPDSQNHPNQRWFLANPL